MRLFLRLLFVYSAWLFLNSGSLRGSELTAEHLLAANSQELNIQLSLLRSAGPKGLAKILAVRNQFEADIHRAKAPTTTNPAVTATPESKPTQNKIVYQTPSPDQLRQLKKLDEMVDIVGGQRECRTSELFWYTDLNKAIAAAKQDNKPILSLRLLGKLTDEYSCANSRFFRTTLYPNKHVRSLLQEKFVLHWETVFPAPIITIDMGDGRIIRRTITGNSCHLVLTSNGIPIDVLPGLYNAAMFKSKLEDLAIFAKYISDLDNDQKLAKIRSLHEQAAETLKTRWADSIQAIAQDIPQPDNVENVSELSLERHEPFWKAVANYLIPASPLSEESISIIRRETVDAPSAGRLALTKMRVEDPVLRLVRNLEESITLDSVRNEYVLHRKIHQLFATGNVHSDPNLLTRQIYGAIFLMPTDDPWRGLVPPDVYTGLHNNGLEIKASNSMANR